MQYTHLGRSAVAISRLCLGTMNFGVATDEGESFAIMDRALELGLNFIDTANAYGSPRWSGKTEELIGRWLAQGGGRRRQVVLATKLFRRSARRSTIAACRPTTSAERWTTAYAVCRPIMLTSTRCTTSTAGSPRRANLTGWATES